MRFVFRVLALALCCAGPAFADPATLGLNVNVVTGSFQASAEPGAGLPTIPIPAFTLHVPVRQFAFIAEEVPPIGPVSYADGLGGTQATKLSYFNSELTWRTIGDRLEFGAGSSLLNQITYYNRSNVIEQFSRVAGFRLSARVRVESEGHVATDVLFAVSPSMHGLQDTKYVQPMPCPPAAIGPCPVAYGRARDPETASLFDVTAQRTHSYRTFGFSYGLRYVNYVARFSVNGRQADHERVVMPFAGVAFNLGR